MPPQKQANPPRAASQETSGARLEPDECVARVTYPLAGGTRYAARQPILDLKGQLFGYELLFRDGLTASCQADGNLATRTMLDNAVMFGLELLTEGHPIFVNCTRDALLQGHVRVLPASLTVLEVLENLEPTEDLINACKQFQQEGYRIALDDFVWRPELSPLVELANFVKIDLQLGSPEQRALTMQKVREIRGPNAVMLAEKVETQAEFEKACAEGLSLFQGYFFCRPIPLSGRQLPTNIASHMEILEEISRDPLRLKELIELVRCDAALTYRVLRFVNSPVYGLLQPIRSIRSAIVSMGEDMFRRVALLSITSYWNQNQSPEILRMALIRANFCETAATWLPLDPAEQYLLGLLSLVPAMLRYPMESMTATLPLRNEICAALLGVHNHERCLLDWIELHEQGLWNDCDRIANDAKIQPEVLDEIYERSLVWAQVTLSHQP